VRSRGQLTLSDRKTANLKAIPSVRHRDGPPREVPISDALLAVLKQLPRRGKWVFPSSTGELWALRQFERATRLAELTGGPHRLRHTFASHFLVKVPDFGVLAAIGQGEERGVDPAAGGSGGLRSSRFR
jgi:integrase